LSATARVYYPFHPYVNRTFKVLQRTGGKPGQVTVELSAGKTLTLPLWMLQPDAASLRIDSTVNIPTPVLLEIVDLIHSSCSDLKPLFDALEHTDGSTNL
jgi:hypothetical protein